MAQKIEIVRGTTNTFQIEIRDAEGALYAPGTGEKVIFGVKRNPDDAVPVIVKTASKNESGFFVVTLSPADTEDMKCGRYFYDVGLQKGYDYYNIIEPSPFVIQQNVTKWGDGA